MRKVDRTVPKSNFVVPLLLLLLKSNEATVTLEKKYRVTVRTYCKKVTRYSIAILPRMGGLYYVTIVRVDLHTRLALNISSTKLLLFV